MALHDKLFPAPTIVPATKNFYLQLLKQSNQWYSKKLTTEKIPAEILKLVSSDIIEDYQVIPIALETENNSTSGRLVLVTDRPHNVKAIPILEELISLPIKILISDSVNVSSGIKHHYDVEAKSNTYAEQIIREDFQDDEEKDDAGLQENSPIVEKVDNIIRAALKRRASDIHILPTEEGSYVLLRIDGKFVNASQEFPVAKREKRFVVNIVKTMCEPPIDISNRLIPHGGSFKLRWKDNWTDFRVSTMPTIRGEKVVIRLLDTSRVPLDLDSLGFLENDNREIIKALQIPSGLFIVTGPVGSGKSTTLHSAIKKFNGLENNTITIEDPVEYKDESLTQVQVREADSEKVKLTAKKILKASLRQDPDNILYGEIRDEEDAEIAIQASQTGHRVLSTLHTKDSISTLDRLFDLGIKRLSLLRELNCIISQRLVSLNCPKCAERYTPTYEEVLLLTPEEIAFINSGTPKRGKGCSACNNGFYSRTVVAEIIRFDNELRDFFRTDHGITEVLQELKQKIGFKTMWEKGLELVKDGVIDITELTRKITPIK